MITLAHICRIIWIYFTHPNCLKNILPPINHQIARIILFKGLLSIYCQKTFQRSTSSHKHWVSTTFHLSNILKHAVSISFQPYLEPRKRKRTRSFYAICSSINSFTSLRGKSLYLQSSQLTLTFPYHGAGKTLLPFHNSFFC